MPINRITSLIYSTILGIALAVLFALGLDLIYSQSLDMNQEFWLMTGSGVLLSFLFPVGIIYLRDKVKLKAGFLKISVLGFLLALATFFFFGFLTPHGVEIGLSGLYFYFVFLPGTFIIYTLIFISPRRS